MQNRHSKKTRVSSSTTSPPPQASPSVPLADEADPKASSNNNNKKGCTRSKRKQRGEENKRNAVSSMEPAEMEGTPSCATSASTSAASQPAGKVAIPRLSNNRSPRPPQSTILLLPSHSQSPSPTINISKPKFVPIQPKPHCAIENGLAAPSLPQLKEEDSNRRAAPESSLEGPWVEGLTHSHDEELAHYWSQPGEAITDSLSPKVPNNELSQLRVLLEQNEGKLVKFVDEITPYRLAVALANERVLSLLLDWILCAAAKKKLATVGLLERRNVRFETPSALSDHQTSVGGLGNGGGVPPSPNTRRMAFNFTPISPRLTPDVPPSPGSSGPVQLRQLLSTNHSGVTSPFVSPGQTPVPSSLPPSQPHSRHNSGHMVRSFFLPFIFANLPLQQTFSHVICFPACLLSIDFLCLSV